MSGFWDLKLNKLQFRQWECVDFESLTFSPFFKILTQMIRPFEECTAHKLYLTLNCLRVNL